MHLADNFEAVRDCDGVGLEGAAEQRIAPMDQICGSHCSQALTHVVSSGVVCVLSKQTTTCSDISAADLLLSRTMELGPVLGTLEVADKTRLHFANVLSSSDNDQSGFITLDHVTFTL